MAKRPRRTTKRDTADDVLDPHHRRQHMDMLRRAVAQGWDVPAKWKKDLPKVAREVAENKGASDRDRIAALKVLQTFDSENAKKLELLDKMDRLDDGKPTERTELNNVRIELVDAEDPDGE